jgi:putative membrane protein
MTVPVAAAGGALAPLQLVFPAAGAYLYYRRCNTLARQGRPVPAGRRLSFGLGITVVAVAISPPVHTLADQLLYVHMAQHLLLADIGALLIVLGLTGPVLQPLLSLPVVDRLRVLAHPAVAFPLWLLDLYVWHLPPLYQAALSNDLVHALEHGAFFLFGVNVWVALFGPLPQPEWFGNAAKLGYILGMRLTYALLGNVLLWSSTVFYPDYGHHEAARHIGGLRDQGLAGTIMMIEGSVLTILLFGWLFMKAASDQEERQQLLEYAEALGVPLSRQRAARAVAAGRADELRGRLARAMDQTASGRR